MVEKHVTGMIHQYREIRDVGEIDVVHRNAVGVFDHNAVVWIEARESLIAGRYRQRLFQRRAVAIDREIAEGNSAATLTTQNRPALEACRRAQDSMIAGDREI